MRGPGPSSPAQPGINPPNRLMTLSALKSRKGDGRLIGEISTMKAGTCSPPKPQRVVGKSASPSGSCTGSSACPGIHFGLPLTREGWQGPAVVAQSHTWSHGSVPAAPQGMLSSHCTPSSAPGRAALSPGTLVPRSWSSLNKPGLFAQQRWP